MHPSFSLTNPRSSARDHFALIASPTPQDQRPPDDDNDGRLHTKGRRTPCRITRDQTGSVHV